MSRFDQEQVVSRLLQVMLPLTRSGVAQRLYAFDAEGLDYGLHSVAL
jgi:hypothetical protein